jgi:regulatory protein
VALRRLAAAAQTRHQLAEALRRRGVPDDVAEEVLDRLEDVGLIDDAAFAEAWVQSRHAGRGLARSALAQELRRRGVAVEIVAGAVSGLDTDAELETAGQLVRRRAAALAGLPSPTRARRLLGLLARKGYPPGLAARVVREVLAEEAAAGGTVAPDADWGDLGLLDAGADSDLVDQADGPGPGVRSSTVPGPARGVRGRR